jgi:hypothetical protein
MRNLPIPFLALLLAVYFSVNSGCSPESFGNGKDSEAALVSDWYALLLEADRHTQGYRAPVAARAYAYFGLAGWEAARTWLPEPATSLASRWDGLHLPEPDPGLGYHLPTVLNSCYSILFQKFFLTTPFTIESRRITLTQRWYEHYKTRVDEDTRLRSQAFGQEMAMAIHAWSATDTLGHLGHLHNFDRDYTPPEGEAFWKPCFDFPTPSMLPYWGNTRLFLLDSTQLPARPLPRFSMSSGSIYYLQALELYTLRNPVSTENRWIGEFWADDHPGLTFSSAGRWIAITNQVIQQEQPELRKVLQTYLWMGLAISDALTLCWKHKYTFNLLRPETLIRGLFGSDWRPGIHTPPAPAYPSGHAMTGAAAAEVLTLLYGEPFAFTDNSHKGRTEFMSSPRHYPSFRAMAAENAYSRIALGVHFRFDCEEGSRLGAEAGRQICRILEE